MFVCVINNNKRETPICMYVCICLHVCSCLPLANVTSYCLSTFSGLAPCQAYCNISVYVYLSIHRGNRKNHCSIQHFCAGASWGATELTPSSLTLPRSLGARNRVPLLQLCDHRCRARRVTVCLQMIAQIILHDHMRQLLAPRSHRFAASKERRCPCIGK